MPCGRCREGDAVWPVCHPMNTPPTVLLECWSLGHTFPQEISVASECEKDFQSVACATIHKFLNIQSGVQEE